MKSVDLSASKPTLTEVMELAGKENVILRAADGREFVLAEIDDFDREIALVRQQGALMQLLSDRSKETARYSLDEVRKRLGP